MSYNSVYQAYKRGARDRNLSFGLTKEEVELIASRDCYYCGQNPQPYNHYFRKKSNSIRAKLETFEEAWIKINGIDRADNNQGYNLANCVPSCTPCNKAKLAQSKDEFLNWVSRVYNHSVKKVD